MTADLSGHSIRSEIIVPPADAQLCYIERGRAYFTTQSLDEQWGDDWNDPGYEHRAGTPYEPKEWRDEGGWEVYVVEFASIMETPGQWYKGKISPWSVEDINQEKPVPWIATPAYHDEDISVYAGASFSEFRDAVERSKGRVFLPVGGRGV